MDARAPAAKTEAATAPDDVSVLPIDIPFPLPPVNCTFVDGAVPTLFDTGCGVAQSRDSLEHQARLRGVDLDRLERIVISHAHIDHAGNAAWLRERSGAEIVIHAEDAPILATWDEIQHERNAAYDEGLQRAGMPQPVMAKMREGRSDVDAMMSSCPVDRVVRDGDTLDAGDRTLTVIHAPGHTAGSAIFWDRSTPWSVTGDALLERITPNAFSLRRDETGALARYMRTLQRLDGLELGAMIPGHGRVFRGIRPTVARAVFLYERRRERILDRFQQAGGPLTTWQIVEHVWPDGQAGAAFLMTSEIQGHLDVLVEDGLLAVTEPDQRDGGGTAALYHLRAGQAD